MTGILENLIDDIQKKVYESDGEVKPEFVVDFIRNLQNHEYDAHIAIMGQNGNGKSMLLLELMKRLDENAIKNDNILYAFNSTSQLIKMLKEKRKTVIGIDELKKFFHYREHSTTEQIVLTNMIEYARSHQLAIIGCCNDVRRINSNYRNAKVQMVIWLLDRYDDNDIGKSYGLVFVGNPALEEDDKFKLEAFQNVYTFEQIRLIAEGLPTFLGYIFVEDIRKVVTEEEISTYLKRKEEGIRKEAERLMKKLSDKEKTMMRLTTYESDKFVEAKFKEIESKYITRQEQILALKEFIDENRNVFSKYMLEKFVEKIKDLEGRKWR